MTPQQLQILELTARIQYFTFQHLFQAGIFRSESTGRNHLRSLRNAGYLTESYFGVTRGVGRLPALYGLTPKAVRYLVDVEGLKVENIKVSKSQKNQAYEVKAFADYFHRVGLIDSVLAVLLTLEKLGTKEDFLELYFRKFGMHEPKRTSIELAGGRLDPDAILSFTTAHKKRLYLVEFYEDSVNVERIRRGIEKHVEALESGSISESLGVAVGHRVLLIFRHTHTAKAVMKFINDNELFRLVADRFLFKTHESILQDALDHWATADGQRVNIF